MPYFKDKTLDELRSSLEKMDTLLELLKGANEDYNQRDDVQPNSPNFIDHYMKLDKLQICAASSIRSLLDCVGITSDDLIKAGSRPPFTRAEHWKADLKHMFGFWVVPTNSDGRQPQVEVISPDAEGRVLACQAAFTHSGESRCRGARQYQARVRFVLGWAREGIMDSIRMKERL